MSSEYQRGAYDVIDWILKIAFLIVCVVYAYRLGVSVERDRQAQAVAEQSAQIALGGAVVIERKE